MYKKAGTTEASGKPAAIVGTIVTEVSNRVENLRPALWGEESIPGIESGIE
jgi:hypothetical protein